jgi:hypothetical protein
MSNGDAAISQFFSTAHVLPTPFQQVLQRLIHITALVSNYLHPLNMFCSGYFIFKHSPRIPYNMSTCAAAYTSLYRTGPALPRLCHHLLQRLLHFTALLSYYLDYVNMCFSVYFILQQWSRITYTMSTFSAVVNFFYSIGLVIPGLCPHVLQRLIHL